MSRGGWVAVVVAAAVVAGCGQGGGSRLQAPGSGERIGGPDGNGEGNGEGNGNGNGKGNGNGNGEGNANGNGAERAPAPWHAAFERSLDFPTLAHAFFGPDDSVVTDGLRFDRDGRFVGVSPFHVGGGRMVADLVAVLPDGRGVLVAQRYELPSAIFVGDLARPPEQADVVRVEPSERLRNFNTVVSPGLDRVVTLQDGELVVHRLPDLVLESRTPVTRADWDAVIGVGSDGAVVHRSVVAGVQVLRQAVPGKPAGPIGDGFPDARAAAVAVEGDAMVVVDAAGVVHALALPTGAPIGAPLATIASDAVEVAIGGGAAAPRVAITTCDRLQIFALHQGAWTELLAAPRRAPREKCDDFSVGTMHFARGGRRLAMVASHLTVLREGGAAPAPVSIAYPVTPPAGMKPDPEVDTWEHPAPTGLAALPVRVGAWSDERRRIWVKVTARDADELAGFADDAAWADAAVVRYATWSRGEATTVHPDTASNPQLEYLHRGRDDRGRRTVEYAIFVREGCDPRDEYVKLVEDGGLLIHVVVIGAPGARVKATLERFFDVPFGVGQPADRKVAGRQRRMGPC